MACNPQMSTQRSNQPEAATIRTASIPELLLPSAEAARAPSETEIKKHAQDIADKLLEKKLVIHGDPKPHVTFDIGVKFASNIISEEILSKPIMEAKKLIEEIRTHFPEPGTDDFFKPEFLDTAAGYFENQLTIIA